MASTNKTANLELPQWELSDKPEMADFNDANEKIDTVVSTHLADNATVISLLKYNSQSFANNDIGSITWGYEYYKNGITHLAGDSKITINKAGKYQISCSLVYDTNPNGRRDFRMFLNDDASGMSAYIVGKDANTSGTTTVLNIVEINLNEGDYIEIKGRQNSGAALNVTSTSRLVVRRMSD